MVSALGQKRQPSMNLAFRQPTELLHDQAPAEIRMLERRQAISASPDVFQARTS